ncbi:DUF397 domain-containing protein [Embleya sp. NPDC050154]|uniref:DUF397 domain-containing protein n=1 Tax=unclassified Embleya TaxID=2699296 RepID=UPI00379D849E
MSLALTWRKRVRLAPSAWPRRVRGDGPMATSLRETHAPTWRRSSYSSVQGNCVEVVNRHPCEVVVRDSKQRACAVLRFTDREWTHLLVALVGRGK